MKLCANSGMTPTKPRNFLVIIKVGIRVLGRLIFTGQSDFGEVERTSATISGVGDPIFRTALRMFKSQLRFQHRE